MYESPIRIITDQLRTEQENHIFNVVQGMGVMVDKEELLKALQYDREQYQKGYIEGAKAFAEEFEKRLRQSFMNSPIGYDVHPSFYKSILADLLKDYGVEIDEML